MGGSARDRDLPGLIARKGKMERRRGSGTGAAYGNETWAGEGGKEAWATASGRIRFGCSACRLFGDPAKSRHWSDSGQEHEVEEEEGFEGADEFEIEVSRHHGEEGCEEENAAAGGGGGGGGSSSRRRRGRRAAAPCYSAAQSHGTSGRLGDEAPPQFAPRPRLLPPRAGDRDGDSQAAAHPGTAAGHQGPPVQAGGPVPLLPPQQLGICAAGG